MPLQLGQLDTGSGPTGQLTQPVRGWVGINPHKNYYLGSRPIPLVNPGTEVIKEVFKF